MGEAIQDLLKQVDLEAEIAEDSKREELKTATGQKRVLKGCSSFGRP